MFDWYIYIIFLPSDVLSGTKGSSSTGSTGVSTGSLAGGGGGAAVAGGATVATVAAANMLVSSGVPGVLGIDPTLSRNFLRALPIDLIPPPTEISESVSEPNEKKISRQVTIKWH